MASWWEEGKGKGLLYRENMKSFWEEREGRKRKREQERTEGSGRRVTIALKT